MASATIIFHLPQHKRTALKLQERTLEAEQTYDANIGAYMAFLQQEAAKAGFKLVTDNQDLPAVYAIDERDHGSKKAAHDWLETQPDIWNWIP